MRLQLLGIVFVIALGVTACGDASTEPAVEPPVRGSSETPTGPIERASASVAGESIVRVIGFGCGAPTLGTGFAVDTNLIVTNGHIVTGRDPESLAVQRVNGTEYSAILVGFDEDLDLALLRIDDAEFRPLNLVTEVPIVAGVTMGIRTQDEKNVINEVDFQVDAPVIVNWDGVFRDTESSYSGIRIDADIRKGDSGSPLLINNTDVIGLVQSKTRGFPRGYAVRSSEIGQFIDSIDPAVRVVADRCA